jgi:hypothetical protein
VRVQIIGHDADTLCLRVALVHQPAHLMGEIKLRPLRGGLDVPPAFHSQNIKKQRIPSYCTGYRCGVALTSPLAKDIRPKVYAKVKFLLSITMRSKVLLG